MINRSPWLWGVRKSAASMTGRTSNGLQILQGKRAKGQSNPSALFLGSQIGSALIWGLWHKVPGFIRENIFNVPNGQYQANVFYSRNYNNALDFTDPMLPTLEVANVIFASGGMTPTSILTGSADVSTGDLTITWPIGAADASQNATDGMWVVVINRNNGHAVSGSVGIRSGGSSGGFDISALSMAVGNNIDVYFSANNNGLFDIPTEGSTSTYFTTVAVA